MEILFHTLIFILLCLLLWSSFVGYKTIQILRTAKTVYGETRFSDKFMLGVTITLAVASGVILFVYPGLIYKLPSVAAVIEVGFAFILFYLHDLQTKNWARFKQTLATR